ncbi:energy-coupling factor transporter transmembrane component T family protein [Tannockella kyphosi]|uniref:energy-coupling factor transporter transmembrane component T family protein n=1 Tax=Tannockella kyphosi TaxID=2899121 RepID=UPI00201276E2|nr:energy-coupling factor transporter transmembrane protein EcfT [Tannockella kyphosi]
MDNITFGKYLPGNSFIHRLDPRLKLIVLMLYLVTIFFNIGYIGYAFLALFSAIVIGISKIPLKFILKAMKPMLFMMVFLLFFNVLLLKTGDLVITILGIGIYTGALIQTSYIVMRIVLILSLTTILTTTTKPLELTLAIESLFNPLKRFGFPSHELAMMISIALRFIPDLLEETQRIMKAQASRGVDFQEGTLSEKIRSIVSLIIPLFLSAFQRAEDLANAMESRNYNPEATRTRYKQLTWLTRDSVLLFLSTSYFLFLIIWRAF